MMPIFSDMFDYYPGNHGLTEEIVYNYQPTTLDERIPIYSGSQNNIVPIGYVRKDARNNVGNDIAYFEGPCLILTKDGSAGILTFRDKHEGIFTINHHACVLKLKGEWRDKVDTEWFALQYKNTFYQYVTSKSDNGVFSTEWFDRTLFELPAYSKQLQQRGKRGKLVLLANKMAYLLESLEEIDRGTKMVLKSGDVDDMGNIIDFKGGNSGLTQDFIYNNRPNNEEESVPILSSATLNINLMGYVSRYARPHGNQLKPFAGPCILVARNGYAGNMKYIETGEFTTNDHAYVLTPKTAWKGKVNLRWFAHQYQALFHNLVTSKSDNATFNKEYAEKQETIIPDICIQNSIAEKLLKIDILAESVKSLKSKVEELIGFQLV